MVIAGVDDEDVTLAHLDPLLDHLGRIDLVIAGGVREIDDGRRAGEEFVQVQAGNVLAGGKKVDLAVQVRAQVVRVGQELAVGTTISNCATRWRFRCKCNERRKMGKPGRFAPACWLCRSRLC